MFLPSSNPAPTPAYLSWDSLIISRIVYYPPSRIVILRSYRTGDSWVIVGEQSTQLNRRFTHSSKTKVVKRGTTLYVIRVPSVHSQQKKDDSFWSHSEETSIHRKSWGNSRQRTCNLCGQTSLRVTQGKFHESLHGKNVSFNFVKTHKNCIDVVVFCLFVC